MRPRLLLFLFSLLLAFEAPVVHARGSSSHPATDHDARPYTKLEHAIFLANKSDDGDSFHVRANGREYIFRLYFVDTPETDLDFKSRVEEQAKYFGITTAQAVRVGKTAAEFTKKTLSAHPFTVQTRWHDARGRSKLERFYAHVFVADKSLAELLVENGLARIYGMPANLPNGTRASVFEAHLRALEAKAKAAKLGAWAYSRNH